MLTLPEQIKELINSKATVTKKEIIIPTKKYDDLVNKIVEIFFNLMKE